MNKRDLVLSLLDTPHYIPGAFFLHFDPSCHKGQAAIDKHIEFFRYTGMDIVKIQYELQFPKIPELREPADWAKLPVFNESFFEEPLAVVKGLVENAKSDALIIMTLYSPFMVAGQVNGQETITRHILENPEKAKAGIAAVTESLLVFVRACIRLGVDGFYTSTQGAEEFRFKDLNPFLECIKPFDLAIMNEVNEKCSFNILHICDYHGGYANLSAFRDYPGDIVNCSMHVGDRVLTGQEISTYFQRPFMGGMERKKTIAVGNEVDVAAAVDAVLENAPERFFLGADCTVPSDTSWDNLRIAIDRAHQPRRK